MGLYLREVVLIAAVVCSGMIAGLFYAYVCSVMPALRGAGDRTSIEVMQRVNRAIQNGWFALSFLGSAVFTAVTVWQHRGDGHRDVLVPAVVALILHVAAMAVTFGVNIPLNNRLDAAGPPDRIPDPAAVRRAFDGPWVRGNLIRMLLTLAAFVALCVALAKA